jgi:hypothetical protein
LFYISENLYFSPLQDEEIQKAAALQDSANEAEAGCISCKNDVIVEGLAATESSG